ncbi:SseB protein N-terminal domain-containing protein [Nocardioides terrae]|uniref:SseB protein N-terminal domain-containing protein n=1 Tax=Nocardioides terrae TaxID=574651 RepID=A0A1I1M2Q7_9ACTN|nr:SseB family protein [Nocardioides terrae]SFC79515.1 SseB protein N-terminal domain-containing protein [Nocardioides terrae]
MTDPQSEQRRRDIAAPAYPDDTGAGDQRLVDVLGRYARRQATYADALAVLLDSRLIVPVVAVLGEVDERGADKTADMATVLLTGADGRQALLTFTSLETMAAWQADARPVGVPAGDAAKAALQDGAAALVLDVAGPVTFVVEGEDLYGLGAGWNLAQVGDGRSAWIRPAGDSASAE